MFSGSAFLKYRQMRGGWKESHYSNSFITRQSGRAPHNTKHGLFRGFRQRFSPGIDKSLDLEKFSRRNDSYFSLSSWRIVFSFLFLFLIFKIFRQKISCSSRFVRFSKQFSFSSRFSRLWRKSSLSTLDLWDSVHCFSFSSCEKCYIFEREICIFQGLRCGGKMLWYEILGGIWCQKRTIAN